MWWWRRPESRPFTSACETSGGRGLLWSEPSTLTFLTNYKVSKAHLLLWITGYSCVRAYILIQPHFLVMDKLQDEVNRKQNILCHPTGQWLKNYKMKCITREIWYTPLKKNWNIRKACYTLIDRQKQIGGEGRGEWKNKTLCVCVTGDCCPSVCPMRWSGHGKNCSTCSLQPFCERGFHVILRPEHVQMGDLQLPRDSADIFLKLALLQVGQCQNVCW